MVESDSSATARKATAETEPAAGKAPARASQLYYSILDTPVGGFLIAGTDSVLHYSSFCAGNRAINPPANWAEDGARLEFAADQIQAYFKGELTQFSIPRTLTGTPFQVSVWKALETIPFGQTVSYGHIAKAIGNPQGSQAVGAANGSNPLPILIPCHRVIGSDGSLTGFGGGLPIKHQLLHHEGVATAEDQMSLFPDLAP